GYGEPYENHYYGSGGDYATSSSTTKITDLVHNSTTEAGAVAYAYGDSRKHQQQQYAHANGLVEDHRMVGYYDGVSGAASASSMQNGHALKREVAAVDYDGSVSGKRQRVVQSSGTWSESSHYQQQQQQSQHQQYPSYRGAQEWQETPALAAASGNPRYHPADADPAMAPYAYGRHDYYHKYHSSVNEAGAASSYHPQYSPPLAAEQSYQYSQQQQQRQQRQRQDYSQQGMPSSAYYGGSQKYEYAQEPSAYYQQQSHPYHGQDGGYYQGSSHYSHPHSGSAAAVATTTTAAAAVGARQTEAYYQSNPHQYSQQQQKQQQQRQRQRQMAGSYAGPAPNDYQQQQQHHHQYASNSSYSGLDTGISMPAPSSSSAWGDYYSQQQQQQQHYQGSHGYHQQQPQQHGYDSRGGRGGEYGSSDPSGYYGNSAQPLPAHTIHAGSTATATAAASAAAAAAVGGGAMPYHRR
ncbi:hypothetical protein LPJ75_004288, partial [Coemansia sp. RSA 2598]